MYITAFLYLINGIDKYRQGDEQDDTDPYKAKYTTDNTVNQAGNNPIHHDFSIGIDVFGAIFFSQPQY